MVWTRQQQPARVAEGRVSRHDQSPSPPSTAESPRIRREHRRQRAGQELGQRLRQQGLPHAQRLRAGGGHAAVKRAKYGF